jgi:hypothetical protein
LSFSISYSCCYVHSPTRHNCATCRCCLTRVVCDGCFFASFVCHLCNLPPLCDIQLCDLVFLCGRVPFSKGETAPLKTETDDLPRNHQHLALSWIPWSALRPRILPISATRYERSGSAHYSSDNQLIQSGRSLKAASSYHYLFNNQLQLHHKYCSVSFIDQSQNLIAAPDPLSSLVFNSAAISALTYPIFLHGAIYAPEHSSTQFAAKRHPRCSKVHRASSLCSKIYPLTSQPSQGPPNPDLRILVPHPNWAITS